MIRSAIPALFVLLAGPASACAQTLEPWPPSERRMDPDTAAAAAAAQGDMVRIPASTCPIGDANGQSSARPAHEVAREASRIDPTEVTNAAFAEYLNALDLKVRSDFPVTEAEFDDFAP